MTMFYFHFKVFGKPQWGVLGAFFLVHLNAKYNWEGGARGAFYYFIQIEKNLIPFDIQVENLGCVFRSKESKLIFIVYY